MTLQGAGLESWLITGILTTTTPLHIGNGDTTTRPGELVNDKNKDIEINEVITDYRDKPYIPGSTIKGNLRAWLTKAGANKDVLKDIFGSDDSKKKDAIGGKAEFHDAMLAGERVFGDDELKRPSYWCPSRQTGVNVSVTINRQTGSAREKRLFHEEFVPAGVSFSLSIVGRDMTKAEAEYLLYALSQSCNPNTDDPLTMGSGTADSNGRFSWKLSEVRQLTQAGVKKWWDEGCTQAGAAIIATYGDKVESLNTPGLSAESPPLRIDVTLAFDGSFLVNDPSRTNDGKADPARKTADHRPRLDKEGKPALPESSFRGAFRAQAEKIIRTMGGWACRVDDPLLACKPIRKASGKNRLCLACQLFGSPGWKSLVEIEPFTLGQAVWNSFTQDFIAVDRFTGGVKVGAKFDAESVLMPTYRGAIKIDTKRIEPWGVGLLALVLRDLCEGDISFGFGSSKGYGGCTGTLTWGNKRYPESPWGDFAEQVLALEQKITEIKEVTR